MAEYSDMWIPPNSQPQGFEKNKFVYVNRNRDHTLHKANTVLINPHFKENKTVFLNPKFQISNHDNTCRPKAHVNPNILKSISSLSKPDVVTPSEPVMIHPPVLQNVGSRPVMPEEKKRIQTFASRMNQAPKPSNNYQNRKPNSYCKINSFDDRKIVHTKTKIVNIPQKSQAILNMNSIGHLKATSISTGQIADRFISNQDSKVILNEENKRKVHTRLKIVNIPEYKKENIKSPIIKQKTDFRLRANSFCTRFKYIRKQGSSPLISRNQKLGLFKTSANQLLATNSQNLESRTTTGNLRKGGLNENNSLRRNSIVTRFKYIRNGAKLIKINKNPIKSKYKIVNNIAKGTPEVKIGPNSSIYRKKYIFLNKYNSSSFLANNVILKNTKQRNLININGILYQNSPCLLKKASLSYKSKLAAINQLPSGSKGKVPTRKMVKCRGKYKIVQSQLASASKLKKSNIACPIYKKTGKCNGQKKGTCIKIHNPDQIILCKSFLRGECQEDNCLLSHKVSSEKMPTCKYFLEGLCNKVECQYLHVKISPNAEICMDFLGGFCKAGIKCDKRHQFLCPEYEKTQKCSKPKCRYPHGSSKVIKPKSAKRNSRKIILQKVTKTDHPVGENPENCQIRYYKDNMKNGTGENSSALKRSNSGEIEDTTIPKRKKLGLLPSFIPIL